MMPYLAPEAAMPMTSCAPRLAERKASPVTQAGMERTATRRNQHLPKGLPPFNGKGRILMKRTPEHRRRWRKWLVAPTLLLAVLAMSGCQTLSYYGQAIKGQYQIVAHEQKIEKLLADPQTPASLKAELALVQSLRAFAAKDLKLPVRSEEH